MELCMPGTNGFDMNSIAQFRFLSSEIANPDILVCPADAARKGASDFAHLRVTNITYLLLCNGRPGSNGEPAVIARCPIHGLSVHSDGGIW